MNCYKKVSVMIPCYNAVNTLPRALCSLLAQTYTNWEAIVVDDGSTDEPRNVVNRIDDSRIKFIKLEKNSGRAFARQVALDACVGDFISLLDADDWLYPDKIEMQVKVLDDNPGVNAVSSGMAITDLSEKLVGVRRPGYKKKVVQHYSPANRFVWHSICFPSTMIRAQIAKKHEFDKKLRAAEDRDYFQRALSGSNFIVLPDIKYVYSEYESVNTKKILEGYAYNRIIFKKYEKKYPLSIMYYRAIDIVKTILVGIIGKTGFNSMLIQIRSVNPCVADTGNYIKARYVVREYLNRYENNCLSVLQALKEN